MRKDHESRKTHISKNTIGRRIFRILLGTALGILLFLTVINIIYVMHTSQTEKERIEELSLHVVNEIISPINEEMDQSYLNLTVGNASSINRFFDGCRNMVEMLASVAGRLYKEDRPSQGTIVGLPTPEMAGEGSIYRVDSEKFDPNDPEQMHALEVMSPLRHVLRSIDSMDSDITSVYFASAQGFTMFADAQAGMVIDDHGNVIPFDATQRDWYQDAAVAGHAICGSLKTDYYTNEPMMTISAPVYADDEKKELIGVAAIDVSLNLVQEILDTSDSTIATACMVDQSGNLQISTSETGLFGLEPNESSNLYRDSNPILEGAIDAASAGETGYTRFYLKPDDTEITDDDIKQQLFSEDRDEIDTAMDDLLQDLRIYKVYYAPIPVLDWCYLYIADSLPMTEKIYQIMEDFTTKTDKQQKERQTAMIMAVLTILVTMTVILVVVYLLSKRLSRGVTKPIVALTKKVQMLSGDKLDFTWDMKADDETQMLAESFEGMTKKIREYIRDLTTVTAEKERIGAELDVARKIQADMLPVDFPERDDFRLYASMTPAKEVGGDFYDFFLIDEDHLGLIIADVSGKGVPAALFMMISKTILQNYAKLGIGAAEILAKTNEALCAENRTDMFVTTWVGILEISSGKLTCANAGHEYPAVCQNGHFALLKDRHGFVLGGMEGSKYSEYVIQLEKGDKIFVYTDGEVGS